MKTTVILLILAFLLESACNKSAAPNSAAPASASTSSAPPAGDSPLRQKLQEYSGSAATNCGRLDVHASPDQLKAASDCSFEASQTKRAFYVSYDMPGMSVGVAATSDGKLFTAQSQGGTPGSALTSGACPSALRVASSGRVTCFAPGDMGSISGSHTTGSMPADMPNPHSRSGSNDSGKEQ